MKKTIIFLSILLFGSSAIWSQVRIGGDSQPGSGAVLDLNESDTGGAELGLSFPRISLTDARQQLKGQTPLNGTVIYNTNSDYARGQGLYYWVDSLWIRVGAMYALHEGRPGDTIAILQQPIIADPQNEAEALGFWFNLNTGVYLESGSAYRFEWVITADGSPDYDPTPYLEYATSKRESVFVPYDDVERNYTAKVRAISEGYNDSPYSEEVATQTAGKFQPSYALIGEPYYDIAATDYYTNFGEKDYGYMEFRSQFKLVPDNAYEYKIVGKGASPTFSWSVSDDNGYASISGSNNDSIVKIQFNSDIMADGAIVSTPTANLPVVLNCQVSDGGFSRQYSMTVQIGDRDVCSVNVPYYDAENNEYRAYRFGDAGCWMTQNLRSTYTIQNGIRQTIPEDNNPLNDNKLAYYYVNGTTGHSQSLGTNTRNPEYGLLYSWAAANVGTSATEGVDAFAEGTVLNPVGKPSDRQGICPAGWVVPSDWDWAVLEKEIATHPEKYSSQNNPTEGVDTVKFYGPLSMGVRPADGNTVETYWGRQMKSPTLVTVATTGTSAIDSTGFNALLVGFLNGGNPNSYGTHTLYWSSSSASSSVAWRRDLYNSISGVGRSTNAKSNLFSVRCKKKDN